MRNDKILPSKRSGQGNMPWFFIGLAVIMFFPSLAPLLPFILLFWYFKKTSKTSAKDRDAYLRQNPYLKSKPVAREPEHYRPKSYRINDLEPQPDIQPDSYVRSAPDPDSKVEQKPHQKQPTAKRKKVINKQQEKQSANRYIFPLLAGAIATIITLFVLNDRIIASIAGISVAVISSLIIFIKQQSNKPKIAEGDELMIEQGYEKADKIYALAGKLDSKPSIQWEVEEISTVVREIFENFVQDPADIKQARSFIRHDLDDAIKLIETYTKVVTSKLSSETHDKRIAMAEASIISVRESFQKLQLDLMENDLLDLEVQSKTLKSVLKNSANFVGEN